MPPAPRRSRRCVRFESDEDSDSDDANTQVPLSKSEQARLAQTALTMADLGAGRHHQMTQDAGPRVRPVNVTALKRGRECNQEGSKANELAMENKQALNSWSNYGQTADAKAAGAEVKEDIAAGNSHRERVKREMQEQGVTKLEDTYDEYRPRGFKNHAGANSAMANDRGRYGTARGGGNAGRGMSRGASMAARSSGRPLDPAVDPDRPYALKSKPPKKKPGIRGEMVQGTVVVKATNKQQGPKKQAGQYSSPRLDRGPLPDHVRQAASPKLADVETFMQATLDMFKKKVESGKIIIADKRYKAAPAPQTTTVQTVVSTGPGPVRSELTSQAIPDLAKKSPKVQHVERKELGVMEKSPDAFTDGNATTATLSGFTPSLASQDGAFIAANSRAGLGIQGATVQDTGESSLTSATDLMDVDIPGAKNSSLKSPLQASPRDSHFSTTEYEEYKILKEFKAYMDSRNSQDFVQWLEKQKSATSTVQATSKEAGKQCNASPIDISGGYTMGGSSLERILGDDKNIAARTKAAKTTQTTPGLAQSKWASSEVQVLSTFKDLSAVQAQAGSNASSSVRNRTKRKLDTIQEVSAPVEPTINDTTSQGPSGKVVQAKRTNPFTRRVDTDSPAAQPISFQAPAVAAESTISSSDTIRDHGARIKQQQQPSKPAKSAGTKNGLSSSMWATDSFSSSSVVNAPRQTTGTAKWMNDASSIFGDSQNVQKPSNALAPISVNTFSSGKKLNDSKFASPDPPAPSKMSLPRPFAGVKTQTTLQDGYRFTPGTPVVGSPIQSEPGSLIGDAKNVQKPLSKLGRALAYRSGQAMERKSTGIKRTNAGPGYEWIMREKAEQEKLDAEKAAGGAKSVDEMVSLVDKYKKMYVGADDYDSDEEL